MTPQEHLFRAACYYRSMGWPYLAHRTLQEAREQEALKEVWEERAQRIEAKYERIRAPERRKAA